MNGAKWKGEKERKTKKENFTYVVVKNTQNIKEMKTSFTVKLYAKLWPIFHPFE